MLGPVDYIVLGFEGSQFDGSIMDELAKASQAGTIRVLDLLFVIKDKQGTITEGEYRDQSDEVKQALGDFRFERDMPLITEQDVDKVGKQLPNNTAAGIMIIEHLWAKDLKQAIVDAGGFLIADGRIHPEVVSMAVKDLETVSSEA